MTTDSPQEGAPPDPGSTALGPLQGPSSADWVPTCDLDMPIQRLAQASAGTGCLEPKLVIAALYHITSRLRQHEHQITRTAEGIDALRTEVADKLDSVERSGQANTTMLMEGMRSIMEKLTPTAQPIAEQPNPVLSNAPTPPIPPPITSQEDYHMALKLSRRVDPLRSITLMGSWWTLASAKSDRYNLPPPERLSLRLERQPPRVEASSKAAYDLAAATALYILSPGIRRHFTNQDQTAAIQQLLRTVEIRRTRSPYATIVSFPSAQYKITCMGREGDYGPYEHACDEGNPSARVYITNTRDPATQREANDKARDRTSLLSHPSCTQPPQPNPAAPVQPQAAPTDSPHPPQAAPDSTVATTHTPLPNTNAHNGPTPAPAFLPGRGPQPGRRGGRGCPWTCETHPWASGRQHTMTTTEQPVELLSPRSPRPSLTPDPRPISPGLPPSTPEGRGLGVGSKRREHPPSSISPTEGPNLPAHLQPTNKTMDIDSPIRSLSLLPSQDPSACPPTPNLTTLTPLISDASLMPPHPAQEMAGGGDV